MEYESLADRTPGLGESSEEKQRHNDSDKQHQGNECVERINEKTHQCTANQTQRTGMPAKVGKGGPVNIQHR